ncbi:hypothetical protein SDC9_120859 [bioreactor metagenome]|uniref:Uncharacterized protein n=1 Tax=bioreactor metagenome TaxID=1076179 RepID=A0A645CAC1_9ZZZZ
MSVERNKPGEIAAELMQQVMGKGRFCKHPAIGQYLDPGTWMEHS